MEYITRYSHLDDSSQFRAYLMVLCVIYVTLTLSLAFLTDIHYLQLLWWLAGYALLSFAMSLMAIALPTIARRILIIIPALLIIFILSLMTKYKISHQMYFSIMAVCFSIIIGFIAKFTLHDHVTQQKKKQ